MICGYLTQKMCKRANLNMLTNFFSTAIIKPTYEYMFIRCEKEMLLWKIKKLKKVIFASI